MGRMVESLAAEYGCDIAGVVDPGSPAHGGGPDAAGWAGVDVAIDFSTPDSVTVNVAARPVSTPGTHAVVLEAPAETITLSHAARDRTAFARGALLAAKWIHGRRGWFTMKDVLGVQS